MTDRSALAVALDYGWWLTGDRDAARRAVRRALAGGLDGVGGSGSAGEPPAGGGDGFEALLRRVRAAAVDGPTLCPASELTLLHDGHAVPLDVAASLVGVEPADARTELAHGRLEALTDLPERPLAHPERLGGLAVGNPADVAHARQCADCTDVRRMLLRGRAEVTALPRAAVEAEEVEPVGAGAGAGGSAADSTGAAAGAAGGVAAPPRRGLHWSVPVAGLAVAVVAGAAAAASIPTVLMATGLAAVVGAVALRPAWAAYVLLAVTPLIAGMDRGAVIPMLRPHEALVAVLGAGLAVHGVGRVLTGRPLRVRVTAVHTSLVLVAVAASVLPLAWLVARGQPVTADDALHAVVLWKYLALFLLVRAAVRTEQQVARCLWLAMAASAVVALVAILQSLQWFGVPQLLAAYYAPFGNERALTINRGTSTLASSIAVGALMSYTLGIALAWLLRGRGHRPLLVGAALLFVVGGLASGQFSAVIALGVGIAAVGWMTGQLRRAVVAAAPAAALGALLLRPVIERRLGGFDSPAGLPHSWVGRLENLRTYFWPELASDSSWLLGVRPSARIAATETWRDWIWMESGHTWLLWTGGVPLALAFVAFVWTALRAVARVARERADAIGVAAVASFASLWTMTVLMTLDVHLTVRGSADLLFPLLALALTAVRARRPVPAPADPDRAGLPAPAMTPAVTS